MDYLVHDTSNNRHSIIDATLPVDAVQKYVDIATRDRLHVNPFNVDVYPITRKNTILSPIDPINNDYGDDNA